jgi:hypothetical protein
MKEYKCTMTVNVFCQAENEEQAHEFFQDMEITFRNPNTSELMDSDLIDWEVSETEKEA